MGLRHVFPVQTNTAIQLASRLRLVSEIAPTRGISIPLLSTWAMVEGCASLQRPASITTSTFLPICWMASWAVTASGSPGQCALR